MVKIKKKKAKIKKRKRTVKKRAKATEKQNNKQPRKRYRCFMFNLNHRLDWFNAPSRIDDIVICPECKIKGLSATFERKYREWARDHEAKERVKYRFEVDPECPRCKARGTKQVSTQGQLQHR